MCKVKIARPLTGGIYAEKTANEIKLTQTVIRDPFWSRMQDLVIDKVIPYQEKILNDEIPGAAKSHALANFRIAAGLEQGDFYGMVFQDSDVAKWLEGVAYSLAVRPDPELEARADRIIETIRKAQQPDGYLNTYFTIKFPEKRWTNLLEAHELYCAGHMMEAAAAYYEVTGKTVLLSVMEKMADHIISWFGEEKHPGIPGHQEVEVGLMRLYHVTGKQKYWDIAAWFLNQRGKNPNYFAEEARHVTVHPFDQYMIPDDTRYNQSHAPVREQEEAVGHSVRAVYMYRAMADLAGATGDESLYQACERLWNNITQKKMYLTAGIGGTAKGESFSENYDLPNDMAYAETCASIGLVFFAKSMLDIQPKGTYADVMERALYNGTISGMDQKGEKFFYVNPLEVNPGISGKVFGYEAVLPERPQWYTCACCPPNLVRMITSLGRCSWSVNDSAVYSHLFLGQEADLKLAKITVESQYPWEGRVSYRISPKEKKEFTLAIHIPSYIKELQVTLNGNALACQELIRDGYLYLNRQWEEQDTLELLFPMKVRRVYSNQKVRENSGCVALMRGPFVYCLEGIDHKAELQTLRLPRSSCIRTEYGTEGIFQGIPLLKAEGIQMISGEDLYSEMPPKEVPCQLTAIPYYLWANRGLNQMRVWILE